VNILAATTIRSQLYDQCQYLVGILLCLSYGIVTVGQIRGRRYNVHHNTVQKLAVNCLCGSHNVAGNGDMPEIFLGMIEVEEKYISGSFMVISAHDVWLLS
jgi:hypothetical protein